MPHGLFRPRRAALGLGSRAMSDRKREPQGQSWGTGRRTGAPSEWACSAPPPRGEALQRDLCPVCGRRAWPADPAQLSRAGLPLQRDRPHSQGTWC